MNYINHQCVFVIIHKNDRKYKLFPAKKMFVFSDLSKLHSSSLVKNPWKLFMFMSPK